MFKQLVLTFISYEIFETLGEKTDEDGGKALHYPYQSNDVKIYICM